MADKVWWGNDPGNVGDWGIAANWDPSGVPIAADNVSIPAGSAAISGSLNQSGVALGTVEVEAGYTGAIGTYTGAIPTYLQIDCTSLRFEGTGESFISLAHSPGTIDVEVTGTGTAATGKSALYLKGDQIDELRVSSGSVGVARFLSETQTVTTIRADGANAVVTTGENSTITNIQCSAGTVNHDSSNATTLIEVRGGTVNTLGSGAVTTMTIHAGTVVSNATGTITTCTMNGGTLDMMQSTFSRNITTLQVHGGTLKIDFGTIIVTTYNTPGEAVTMVTSEWS